MMIAKAAPAAPVISHFVPSIGNSAVHNGGAAIARRFGTRRWT